MGQQPQLLEVGELVPDRGWSPYHTPGQNLGADGRAYGEVFLDHLAQHKLLPVAQGVRPALALAYTRFVYHLVF